MKSFSKLSDDNNSRIVKKDSFILELGNASMSKNVRNELRKIASY